MIWEKTVRPQFMLPTCHGSRSHSNRSRPDYAANTCRLKAYSPGAVQRWDTSGTVLFFAAFAKNWDCPLFALCREAGAFGCGSAAKQGTRFQPCPETLRVTEGDESRVRSTTPRKGDCPFFRRFCEKLGLSSFRSMP